MRIKVSEPKIFFDEIMANQELSLKDLCKKLHLHYSPVKRYRRGELTIPKEIFSLLLQLSPRKEYWFNQLNMLDDSWWCSKAGKISSQRNDMNLRMAHARKFRKIPNVEITLNSFFCEFFGALLGDGCISRFQDNKNKERFYITLSGNKKLDSEYLKSLKERIKKEYGIYSYYYEYKNRNICVLIIKNKGLCLQLHQFGMPIGRKYDFLKIPEEILKLSWKEKKYLLRGLLDTDGSIYSKKNEDYRYPHVSISSKNIQFLMQLKDILKERGYPAYVIDTNVYVRGIKNVHRWFKDIGSSNQRNILKYQYFLKHKRLPPRVI